MKLLLPVAAALSLSAHVEAWSVGPRFYGMNACGPTSMRKQRYILQKKQDMFRKAFTQVSPRYEITDTDEKFQVSLDVPGVNIEDIQVNFEEDGSVLSVKGRRAASDEGRSYTTQFSQSFSVDPAVDVEKFTAKLKNGVLIITAPKDMKKIEENIRKIPITEVQGDETLDNTSVVGEVEVHEPEKKDPETDGKADEPST